MKNLLTAEIKALFTNKKLLIPVIALLFIPVLYSGMFLWAFWDPYDHLQDLPVVIVNEDTGASFEGQELSIGNDLVEKLKESNEFAFDFKNKEEAYEKLQNQEYYLLVEIPENFSENATTLLNENPEKLSLLYVPNESYNFLAAQIGGTAIEQIKASISDKVTETYSETMFSKLEELVDGVQTASEGAGKLADGSIEVMDGTNKLYENLSTLANSSIEFKEGMNSAYTGSQQLSSGLTSLSDGLDELKAGHTELSSASNTILAGSKELASGLTQSKAGIEQMNEKVPALTNGTEQLATGAGQLAASLGAWSEEAQKINSGYDSLEQALSGVLNHVNESDRKQIEGIMKQLKEGSAGLSSSADIIADKSNSLSTNLNDLYENQKALEGGIGQLAKGSQSLETGVSQLIVGQEKFQTGMTTFDEKFGEAQLGAAKLLDGTTTLEGGLGELSNGTDKLASGATQLEEGAGKLSEGSSQLSEGSTELAQKLHAGSDEASEFHVNDNTSDMMASPVEIENGKINEVPNYGTGFAPYFISLGLFVGALLLSIVFPLREPVTVPRNGFSWFVSKFTVLSCIGIIQGLITSFVLIKGLGLEVGSLPLFLLFVIVTSITFMALIQFLVTAFGDPGRFIAILVLIFQLTTSAGTFPLELIPNFLQHFNAFLPMTYTVQGFKAVISSGDYSFMWQNLLILVGFMFVFVLGSLSYFNFKHKRQFHVLVKEG